MRGIAKKVTLIALLLAAHSVAAQTYTSENLESYRGKEITLSGTASALNSNALTRLISGCHILIDTRNGNFKTLQGEPRTTWVKISVPCGIYQRVERGQRNLTITGTLVTWYPGKYVRGANVRPLNINLDNIR